MPDSQEKNLASCSFSKQNDVPLLRLTRLPSNCTTPMGVRRLLRYCPIVRDGITLLPGNGEERVALIRCVDERMAEEAVKFCLTDQTAVGAGVCAERINEEEFKVMTMMMPTHCAKGGDVNSVSDSRSTTKQSTPVEDHRVRISGLPWSATQADIAEFFSPLTPTRIRLLEGEEARRRGDADVWFCCRRDWSMAMGWDGKYMGNRYVRVFPR